MSSSLSIGVLIGNGFDLAAGLKTGTKDFISQFAKEHGQDDGSVGRLARQIESEGIDIWADFERMLGVYAKNISQLEPDPVKAALDCKEAIDIDLMNFIKRADAEVTDEFIERNAKKVIDSLAFWRSALRPIEKQMVAQFYSTPYNLGIRFITFNYTTLLPSCAPPTVQGVIMRPRTQVTFHLYVSSAWFRLTDRLTGSQSAGSMMCPRYAPKSSLQIQKSVWPMSREKYKKSSALMTMGELLI